MQCSSCALAAEKVGKQAGVSHLKRTHLHMCAHQITCIHVMIQYSCRQHRTVRHALYYKTLCATFRHVLAVTCKSQCQRLALTGQASSTMQGACQPTGVNASQHSPGMRLLSQLTSALAWCREATQRRGITMATAATQKFACLDNAM